MNHRTRKTAAVGAAAATGMVLLQPGTAWAGTHSVQTLVNGGHHLILQGDEHEVGSGLEHWFNIRSSETAPIFDTVCSYQGWMGEIHPGGQLVFTEYSSHHKGCSWLIGFFDWPGWDSNYPENVHLRGKWKSDNTPASDWWTIGDLRD